jgi:hypothetical protein
MSENVDDGGCECEESVLSQEGRNSNAWLDESTAIVPSRCREEYIYDAYEHKKL